MLGGLLPGGMVQGEHTAVHMTFQADQWPPAGQAGAHSGAAGAAGPGAAQRGGPQAGRGHGAAAVPGADTRVSV